MSYLSGLRVGQWLEGRLLSGSMKAMASMAACHCMYDEGDDLRLFKQQSQVYVILFLIHHFPGLTQNISGSLCMICEVCLGNHVPSTQDRMSSRLNGSIHLYKAEVVNVTCGWVFRSNLLDCTSMQSLVSYLKHTPTLQQLNLSDNPLEDSGIRYDKHAPIETQG